MTIVTPAAVQFVLQLVLFFGTLFFFIIGPHRLPQLRRELVRRRATRGCAR